MLFDYCFSSDVRFLPPAIPCTPCLDWASLLLHITYLRTIQGGGGRRRRKTKLLVVHPPYSLDLSSCVLSFTKTHCGVKLKEI